MRAIPGLPLYLARARRRSGTAILVSRPCNSPVHEVHVRVADEDGASDEPLEPSSDRQQGLNEQYQAHHHQEAPPIMRQERRGETISQVQQ